MKELPVCPYCNEQVQKTDVKRVFQNKTFHSSCYYKYFEDKYNNKQPELTQQKPAKPRKQTSQEVLYDYLCSLFGITELTPLLNHQLQKMLKENKFTYEGIYFSLKYYFEIKENPVIPEYGIGIVPLIYNDAKIFFLKKQTLREKNGKNSVQISLKNQKQNEKNVYITQQKEVENHFNKFFTDISKL